MPAGTFSSRNGPMLISSYAACCRDINCAEVKTRTPMKLILLAMVVVFAATGLIFAQNAKKE